MPGREISDAPFLSCPKRAVGVPVATDYGWTSAGSGDSAGHSLESVVFVHRRHAFFIGFGAAAGGD